MSGNPSHGILDRVPYIGVLHVWDNASGMVGHGVSLDTACKVQDKGSCLSCMIDVVTRLSILVVNLKQVSLCIKKEGGVNA